MATAHPQKRLRFRLHPREAFRYEYDFIANWRVDIRLEEILPQDQRVVVWVEEAWHLAKNMRAR